MASFYSHAITKISSLHCRDGVIKIWTDGDYNNTKAQRTMSCVFTMKAHQKAVTCGCWHGTNLIATGSDDKTIVLWYVVQKPGNLYR